MFKLAHEKLPLVVLGVQAIHGIAIPVSDPDDGNGARDKKTSKSIHLENVIGPNARDGGMNAHHTTTADSNTVANPA
jgi:hypothetical protein